MGSMIERRRRSAHQAAGRLANSATVAESGRLSVAQAARADVPHASTTGSKIHPAAARFRISDVISKCYRKLQKL
jgi:hypothetical protein